MSIASLQIKVLPDGSLDVWRQRDGGPVESFDPAQLPDEMRKSLDEVTTVALARVLELEKVIRSHTTELETANKATDEATAKLAEVEYELGVYKRLNTPD